MRKKKMKNKYPIFIPSKGRHDIKGTAHLFRKQGVPFRLVVEPQEVQLYTDEYGSHRVIELDMNYQTAYETLDDYGSSLSYGPGPARNFAGDVAREENSGMHWTIDDNLQPYLVKYGDGRFTKIRKGGMKWFGEIESLITKFNNVAMGGPYDFAFFLQGNKTRQFIFNTRVYSFNLIRNNLPLRWRGRWNEDTILSIDVLKMGFATCLVKTHMMHKMSTNVVKGGNTGEFYGGKKVSNTGPKTRGQLRAYPEYTKIVKRFDRIHHFVDYQKHFSHIPPHI